MDLLGLSREELAELMSSLDGSRYRADQILNWLYKKPVVDVDGMANLPTELRLRIKEAGWRAQAVTPSAVRKAADGTARFLFDLEDGHQVEGVYLPEEERQTVCLSSQVGCGIQCAFCATGRSGLVRNLTAGEMVDSVRRISMETGRRISHVVVMGQGEPLANYEPVMKALSIINAPYGLGIAARHITISTCGIIPRILELAKDGHQYNLAISLHATDNELRNKLVPINKRYPLEELRQACQKYTESSGRRITLEYILLRGVNDREADLNGLIRFARGWLTHVNLLPFNPVSGIHLEPSSPSTVRKFLAGLERAGIPATLRKSRGDEVMAACGQLRQEIMNAHQREGRE